MKKILILLLVLCLTLSMFAGCGSQDRSTILKVYNWADYIDEDLIDEFEAYYFDKYGIALEVQYTTYDTNEIMYNKIAQAKEDYDVVCPSEYMIERMMNANLLLPIDSDIIDGIYQENVPEFIIDNLAEMSVVNGETYAVGYMWGTIGIMYNTNEVSLEELEAEGWGILWNEKYTNKIFMKDSIRDTFAVGNLYAFEDEYIALLDSYNAGDITAEEYHEAFSKIFNDTSAEAIAAVEAVLAQQKTTVQAMYDVDYDKDAMVNGTAYLDVAWSGDAMWAIWEAEEAGNGVELGYYIPESGTNIWFDGWVIPAYAGNVQAANEWIAFMLEEETAIANMDYIGYTSVVAGTSDDILEYVQEYAFEDDDAIDASYFFGEDAVDVTLNSTMYPSSEIILSAGVMRDFGDADDAVTEMWTRIKGNEISWVVIAVIAVVVIAGVVFLVLQAKKNSKGKAKSKAKKKSKYVPK